jgi:hypothetical protein
MSDTRGLSVLDGFLQDLRYTFRTLRRDVGFTTFAVLIVGLGIGASHDIQCPRSPAASAASV